MASQRANMFAGNNNFIQNGSVVCLLESYQGWNIDDDDAKQTKPKHDIQDY